MQDNYSPPLLTVVEVRVEHGFWVSVDIGVTGGDGDGAYGSGDVNTGVPDFWD